VAEWNSGEKTEQPEGQTRQRASSQLLQDVHQQNAGQASECAWGKPRSPKPEALSDEQQQTFTASE
jgi:hypothetical protein